MPIIVRHTPATLVGQLAIQAGQAQGRQLQMGRDLQLTSMMLAAEERGADEASRRATAQQAFRLQQTLATQAARGRPVAADVQEQRRRLQTALTEAEQADIYTPSQLKQMRIFADLGDEDSFKQLLGTLPKPKTELSASERELQRQAEVIPALAEKDIKALQTEIDRIDSELGERYNPYFQDFLMKNPQYMPKDTAKYLTQTIALRDALRARQGEIAKEAAIQGRAVALGISVPEQVKAQIKAAEQESRAEERALDRQIRQTGRLTDQAKLGIDLIRDAEKGIRRELSAEIARLSKTLTQYTDESTKEHKKRIVPIRAEIQQLELQRVASCGREGDQIAKMLALQSKTPAAQTISDSSGQKWRFTGRYEKNQPIYEAVE